MHKAGFMDDNYRTVRSGLSFERFYSFPGPRFFPLRNGSCQACALILLFSRICKPPPSSRSTTDKYVQAQTRGLLGPRYLILFNRTIESRDALISFLFLKIILQLFILSCLALSSKNRSGFCICQIAKIAFI